jgi:hypothetical protein
LLVNGDFEGQGGWAPAPEAIIPPQLSVQVVHGGDHAIVLGIDSPARQLYGYSAIVQRVTLPPNTEEANLTFWYRPRSDDQAGDVQYAMVEDEQGNQTPLLRFRSGDEQWHRASLSLSAYAGQTILVQLGVFNDGQGGVTSMVVDDVALQVRTSGSAKEGARPPAPKPAVSPTATPGATSGETAGSPPPVRRVATWTIGVAFLFLLPLLALAL